MARKRKEPVVTEFTTEALQGLVARCAERLPPEDNELLASLVTAFLLVSQLVRDGRATLKRLRRLFGLRSSEKSRDIFPDGSDTKNGGGGGTPGDSPAPDGSASSALASVQTPNTGTQGGSASLDPTPKPPAKGHGRRAASAYPEAEHIFVVHGSLTPGCNCPACTRGSLYDLKRPSPWLRIFGQALLLAKCWNLQQLRCGACGKVFTASPPPEACGPKFSESAAAVLALMRFGLGTPLYRLDRLQQALGTPVSDATQWDVLYARALELYPAYCHLLHLAAQARLVHLDDTYVRVLQYMGKRRAKLLEQEKLPRPDRTGLHTTGIVACILEGQLGLFITGRRHAGENLDALLERRAKELEVLLVMCDGLGHNIPKGKPVLESNCMAHGRRGVVEQAESFPAECKYVLDQIGRVYAVEDVCRDEGLSPGARLWMHQLISGPVMDQLRAWMTAQLEEKRVEPNSELGRAFNYMLKRWDKLTVFLRVPGAAIDNNICERLLKTAVLNRKNSLFFRSERGAVVGDIYMSLIRTAILHGQNPIDYLTALMTHSQAVAGTPGEWMPWNYRQTLAALTASPTATDDAPLDAAAPAEPASTAATVSEAAPPVAPPSPPAKRQSRSHRRAIQSGIPPPAFALLMLLCVGVTFFAAVHRSGSPMTQPAIGHNAAFGSRPMQWLVRPTEGRVDASCTGAVAITPESLMGPCWRSLAPIRSSCVPPTRPTQRTPP